MVENHTEVGIYSKIRSVHMRLQFAFANTMHYFAVPRLLDQHAKSFPLLIVDAAWHSSR